MGGMAVAMPLGQEITLEWSTHTTSEWRIAWRQGKVKVLRPTKIPDGIQWRIAGAARAHQGGPDLLQRDGGGAVHSDMAATARGRRCRTALIEPHGPQPNVHASRVH